MIEFCGELGPKGGCEDVALQGKQAWIASKKFHWDEIRSVDEVDTLLRRLGWTLVEKRDRSATYCKRERTASYVSADDGGIYIAFAGGSDTCRKK